MPWCRGAFLGALAYLILSFKTHRALGQCSCEGPPSKNLDVLADYVRSLDIWIVSSGGVASNALGAYLYDNNIYYGFTKPSAEAKANFTSFVSTCHPPYQFVANPPSILYVYGDLRNALQSVLHQHYMLLNMEKLTYGTDSKCRFGASSLESLLESNHPDPYGVAHQLKNFMSVDTPTVFLNYPFTGSSLSAQPLPS